MTSKVSRAIAWKSGRVVTIHYDISSALVGSVLSGIDLPRTILRLEAVLWCHFQVGRRSLYSQ